MLENTWRVPDEHLSDTPSGTESKPNFFSGEAINLVNPKGLYISEPVRRRGGVREKLRLSEAWRVPRRRWAAFAANFENQQLGSRKHERFSCSAGCMEQGQSPHQTV